MPEGYENWRQDIVTLIAQAKYKAVLNVNAELLALYWKIGTDIIKKQKEQGWGTQVIAQLSKDLAASFPDDKGYSDRNLRNMQRFAEAYPDFPILQVPLAKLTEKGKDYIQVYLTLSLGVNHYDWHYKLVAVIDLAA